MACFHTRRPGRLTDGGGEDCVAVPKACDLRKDRSPSLTGGEGVVADRLREEREAKEMLARLDGMDPQAPGFEEQLDRLRVAVLTHARAEERYEFHRIRGGLGEAERRGLAAVVKAAEAIAPTRPHPGTESAAANPLTGPAMAIADRVRDLIRAARR